MKAICQPDGAGSCSQCKQPLPARTLRTCPVGPNAHLLDTTPAIRPCSWRGEITTAFALVKCDSCGGNVRQKLPVCDCALFGGCVPMAAGNLESRGGNVQGCVGCRRAKVF